jgi:lactate permease
MATTVFVCVGAVLYGMPATAALLAAANGALFGAWPVCLILFAGELGDGACGSCQRCHGLLWLVRVCVCVCAWSAAIFLYDMCVVTGHFETVKFTIVSLSSDKRLLALLLAYCFSSFVEGKR